MPEYCCLACEVANNATLNHDTPQARCFKYLHHEQSGNPLIHRDLKPANVLITNDLRAKVADFGESTRFDEETAGMNDDKGMTMTMVSCFVTLVSYLLN